MKKSPTQPGDVLILRTSKSYTIYAVGSVAKKGQGDFTGQEHVQALTTQAAAATAAKALVAPHGRIHLLDIDTGEWSEIVRSA